MAGRMSPLHGAAGLTGTNVATSVPPASRNGGSSNADINGETLNVQGRRGVIFILSQGVTTGAAATAARIQVNDLPSDPANGNWSNVNYTAYSNARVTNQTTDNQQYIMDVTTSSLSYPVVRAVLTPEANAAVAGITHIIY